MKNCVLLLFLILNSSLIAQTQLPQAGEFLPDNQNRTELIKLNNGIPFSAEPIIFDSSNTCFEGNYPFSVSYALAISEDGDLVFIGSGGGILVTDVSDPANPTVLSEIRTRSLVDDCTYDPVNQRLYVCAYFAGIEIWDLSDITHPVIMSRIPTEPYPRSGVAYKDDHLFIATNTTIWSIDISDPYNPSFADDLFLGNSLMIQLYMKDDIVYIISNTQGIFLIDASNPVDLMLIDSYPLIAGSKIDIKDNYLYAVGSTGMFRILNITDPSNVTMEGSINISGYPDDIKVIGNYAYVAKVGTDGGLEVINIEDPAAPVSVSLYTGDYHLVSGIENYIYLSRNSDFSVLDITDPSSIQYVTGFELAGFIQDVSALGDYVYTGSNGFRVVDISDHANPVQVGYADVMGDLVEAAENDLVVYCPYSMTANNTINIMDVSDPVNPVSLSSFTCPAMTWDLVVRDSLAFIACWWDGIRIFNFNDPANLTQVTHAMGWQQGSIPGTDWCYAQAVAVEGDYLYIVDYQPFEEEDTYGLYILDIEDPSNPSLINRFQGLTSNPRDIAVQDQVAYISDGNGGVEIVDVTDPMNPAVVSYVSMVDGSTGINVDGDYAYSSNYILGGVQVIDIKDPANPILDGWYKPTGCFAVNIDYEDGYIFAADGIAGFQIYRNLNIPISVESDLAVIPGDYKLDQNFPNPFNPETRISFTLPQSEYISLKIFNIIGEEVATLINGLMEAGTYSVNFNAEKYSNGIYLYKLTAGDFTSTKKMMLLK